VGYFQEPGLAPTRLTAREADECGLPVCPRRNSVTNTALPLQFCFVFLKPYLKIRKQRLRAAYYLPRVTVTKWQNRDLESCLTPMPTFFSTGIPLLMQTLGLLRQEARPCMGLEEPESLWGVGGRDTACAVLGRGSV